MAEAKPEWIKIKPQELQKIIIDLHKENNSPAKIGLILRDKHGIPKTKLVLNKKISKILSENNYEIKKEKEAVAKKIEILEKHISKNKHDYTSKRSLAKKTWILKK